MDYNPDCPAWGNLTWPKVGEFDLANGDLYQAFLVTHDHGDARGLLEDKMLATRMYQWRDLLHRIGGDQPKIRRCIVELNQAARNTRYV